MSQSLEIAKIVKKAPILADIYSEDLLESVIPKIPFKIPFLFKYVDDILIAIPTEANSKEIILVEFNKFSK